MLQQAENLSILALWKTTATESPGDHSWPSTANASSARYRNSASHLERGLPILAKSRMDTCRVVRWGNLIGKPPWSGKSSGWLRIQFEITHWKYRRRLIHRYGCREEREVPFAERRLAVIGRLPMTKSVCVGTQTPTQLTPPPHWPLKRGDTQPSFSLRTPPRLSRRCLRRGPPHPVRPQPILVHGLAV